MNLFELFVKIGVDDQASKNISKISQNLGEGIKKAAKVATTAIATASAGIAALTASAVKNYADYEQLVGGVETLFKKSSDQVMKYAENAYKTAGMSANEYMETVTGFSASLLQSLNGDTEEAAKKADLAITDMSDNANKMGSSLETLKTAYAGFAKGQFMLLDNLKLGYGGTKEEMERLLVDAQAISGIEYDLSSYADIVDAIHVIQTEMGITGTTAKEASSTIAGSLGMVKASWKNLTVAIANENADVEENIDEFVGSVSTAMDNILPRVEIALGGVTKLIGGILPKIAESIPTYIAKYVPQLISSGASVVKSLAKGIKNNAKVIVDAAKDTLLSLIDSIPDLIPDVIDAGVELLSSLVEAVPEVAVKVFKAMPKIVNAVVRGLVTGAAKIVKAFVGIFVDMTDKSEEAMKRLATSLSTFESFYDTMEKFEAKTIDLSKAVSKYGNTISDVDEDIAKAENNITEILKNALSAQQKLRDEDLKNIQKYNDLIREKEAEKIGIYRDAQLAEYRKTMLDIGEMDAADLAKALSNAQLALDAANKAVEDSYTSQLTYIENLHKAKGTVGSKEYNQELAAAKAERDKMLRENENLYNQTFGVISSRSEHLANYSLQGFAEINKAINNYHEALKTAGAFGSDLTERAYEGAWFRDLLGLDDETIEELTNRIDKLDLESANAFLALQAQMANTGIQVSKESQDMASTILGAFQELPGEMGDVTREGLMALIDGLENEIPELRNAGEMTADEIIKAIEDHLKNTEIDIQINAGATVGVDGSHAQGLSYVPYDGYIAELHQGERVLTKQEAAQYSSGSIGDITININGAQYESEETLAIAVAEAIQGMMMRKEAVYA